MVDSDRGVGISGFVVTQDAVVQALNAMPANIAVVDERGIIVATNERWDRFGEQNGLRHPRNLVGLCYLDACTGSHGQIARTGILGVLAADVRSFDMEYPCHSPTQQRWFTLHCEAMGNGLAGIAHFEVTAQKTAEIAVGRLATHDFLTGAMNRRGIESQLHYELNRIVHGGEPLAAILLDCDNFKLVNDLLGHAGGDVIINTVTQRIQSVLRSSDSLARIGGDEFVVLLPNSPVREAALVSERIRLAVSARPIATSHGQVSMTVSAAIAAVDQSVHSLEQLLDRCQMAGQASKRNGRNRTTIDASSLSGADSAFVGSTDALLAIITERRPLAVAAQPIVELSSSRIVGYELLTRCVGPEMVAPSTLFQLANERGFLASLDERCLVSSLAAAAQLAPDMDVHVNCYPSTLLSIAPDRLESVFVGAGVDVARIVIELNEQQMLGDPGLLLPCVENLREIGVRIALDDVGFGGTFLEAAIVLQPDIIKADLAYVRGIARDQARRTNMARLIAVADALGAQLIAEGVEEQSDADALVQLGAVFAQGFFFGHPELI